jgi:hypothetical protein
MTPYIRRILPSLPLELPAGNCKELRPAVEVVQLARQAINIYRDPSFFPSLTQRLDSLPAIVD